jgi:hypothetical protein
MLVKPADKRTMAGFRDPYVTSMLQFYEGGAASLKKLGTA